MLEQLRQKFSESKKWQLLFIFLISLMPALVLIGRFLNLINFWDWWNWSEWTEHIQSEWNLTKQ